MIRNEDVLAEGPMRGSRNLVPLPYRRVSVQPWSGPMTAAAIRAHLLGREAYRRTDFVVLRAPAGAIAVAAMLTRAASGRRALFSSIDRARRRMRAQRPRARARGARARRAARGALGLEPGAVVLAAGSGSTRAGWLLGRRLVGATWRVEGVTVSRPAPAVRARVARLASDAAALLGASFAIPEHEVIVHDGHVGPGYGVPSDEGLAAIRSACRRAGVFLDPTYTGKAFAALAASTEGA
jgi:hypothetical protein